MLNKKNLCALQRSSFTKNWKTGGLLGNNFIRGLKNIQHYPTLVYSFLNPRNSTPIYRFKTVFPMNMALTYIVLVIMT